MPSLKTIKSFVKPIVKAFVIVLLINWYLRGIIIVITYPTNIPTWKNGVAIFLIEGILSSLNWLLIPETILLVIVIILWKRLPFFQKTREILKDLAFRMNVGKQTNVRILGLAVIPTVLKIEDEGKIVATLTIRHILLQTREFVVVVFEDLVKQESKAAYFVPEMSKEIDILLKGMGDFQPLQKDSLLHLDSTGLFCTVTIINVEKIPCQPRDNIISWWLEILVTGTLHNTQVPS